MNRTKNTAKKQASSRASSPDSISARLEAYLGRAQRFLQEFLFRAGRPVDTMWHVAQQRYAEGEFADAASRLRIVVKLQPENAAAWYLLGSSELEEGNEEMAKVALRKTLQLNPQHEEARFLLAVLNPNMPEAEQPKIAPLSLAVQHFDAQALYYDQQHLYEMGYTGHEEAYHAVRRFLEPGLNSFRVVDLGCGTGLAALQFRGIAGHVEGVDISRNMLNQAETRRDESERRIFDALHHLDLRRFLLDTQPASFDIIVAADVFPYLGGLTPVFDGLNHALKPGGVVTFSIEPRQGQDYGLIPSAGRYGHSEAYIIEQAERVGLEVLEVKPFEIFIGEEAMQFVLRKPGGTTGQKPPSKPEAQQPPAAAQGQQGAAQSAPAAPPAAQQPVAANPPSQTPAVQAPATEPPAAPTAQTPPQNRPPEGEPSQE